MADQGSDIAAFRDSQARLIACLEPLQSASGVVLAVSGGPDSTALMQVAAWWKARGDAPPLAVATVDHGLRPESASEADAVVGEARRLGFDAVCMPWDGPKPQRGLPARARAARYGLLRAHAHAIGASHLATAHTLDDQAETVLMRLAHGSGLRGLGGMRAVATTGGITLVRPFLGVRKADLVALCHDNRWPYAKDSTNADAAYARARWRALAPALAREGLTPETLALVATRLARAEAALESWTAELSRAVRLPDDGSGPRLSMTRLAPLPFEMIVRLIGAALIERSGRPQPKLDGVEALAAAVIDAHAIGRGLHRTLHHCLIELGQDSVLRFLPEAPRRRGRRLSGDASAKPFATNDAAPGPSLGKAGPSTYIASVVAPALTDGGSETQGASADRTREPMFSTGPQ